jgi:leucyl-tRNA---protein transferase
MQDQIFEFISGEKTCSYLQDENSLFRYYQVENCSCVLYQNLLERGWRRFGRFFFTPICCGCEECLSIRTQVDLFVPNRTMKRTLRKNENLNVCVQRPTVTLEHLALYDSYHRFMRQKKQWEYNGISLQLYFEMFVEGHEMFGYEFLYFDAQQLIGVALVDVLEDSLSAVYCFYDPAYQNRSLGSFSILKQIEFAHKRGIRYFYPGYWIQNHKSMGYKHQYKPYEILQGRPHLNEVAVWK